MATKPEDISKFIEDEIRKQLMANRGETVEEEKVDLSIEKKEQEVKNGQVMFSKLFKVKVDEHKDFPVTVFKPKNWDPQIRALIPSIDPSYVLQVEEAMKVMQAMEDGDKILVTGPTGSGKSTLIKYLCAHVNRPFVRMNMNGDIESSAIFGAIVVEGGATVWKDGAGTEAVKYGAVCLIDEWEIMPPDIGMGWQCVLEDNGFLFLKEKPGTSEDKLIIPHKEFRLIYAGNTVGQGDESGSFAGVNVQNTATIDRFQCTVHLGYLDKAHETAVLKNSVAGLKPDIIKKMLQYADLVRTANQQGNMVLTMSPRTLINWGKKIMRYGQIKEALMFAFVNKLSTNDKKLAMDLYMKVFGK